MTATGGASRITTRRRTKAEVFRVESDLYDIFAEIQPATGASGLLQTVSGGIIAKAEDAYMGIVCRLLTRLRRNGELPYQWIADNTCWMRQPTSYSSVAQMLNESVALYRCNLWADQRAYVEVGLRKDALAGLIYPVTQQWDVPLIVTPSRTGDWRGYNHCMPC